MTLPSSLQSLNFGSKLNKGLPHVMLPSELLDWTSFRRFKRSLERKALGVGDNHNYTFCTGFDKSLNGVSFPRSLQNRFFGDGFNQALGASTFPSSLKT